MSILTTTGYVSDDYARWGAFPQILLLFLMITGGCAGSTAGGVKWVRILLVFQYIHMELLRLLHPRLVIHAKINQTRVSREILSNIFAFIFLYLTTLAVTTLLIALDGQTFLTSLGAAASALGNIGPGLEQVGPVETYFPLSAYAKWVLILAMLMGRLELMTVLVLFMPGVWRR
jgi:trk system potassium uptake protein TrkH